MTSLPERYTPSLADRYLNADPDCPLITGWAVPRSSAVLSHDLRRRCECLRISKIPITRSNAARTGYTPCDVCGGSAVGRNGETSSHASRGLSARPAIVSEADLLIFSTRRQRGGAPGCPTTTSFLDG